MAKREVEVWQRAKDKIHVEQIGEWLEIDVGDHCFRIRGGGKYPTKGKAKGMQGPVTFGSIKYDDQPPPAGAKMEIKKMSAQNEPPAPGPNEGWVAYKSSDTPKNVVAARLKLTPSSDWYVAQPTQAELPPGHFLTKAYGLSPGQFLQGPFQPGEPHPQ